MIQDCKEFQGELFGISNLFRDLSEKLFTSEIIHSHDKQGTQHERVSGEKQSLSDFGMCFLPPQAKDTFFLESESNESFVKVNNKRAVPINGNLGKDFFSLLSTLLPGSLFLFPSSHNA